MPPEYKCVHFVVDFCCCLFVARGSSAFSHLQSCVWIRALLWFSDFDGTVNSNEQARFMRVLCPSPCTVTRISLIYGWRSKSSGWRCDIFASDLWEFRLFCVNCRIANSFKKFLTNRMLWRKWRQKKVATKNVNFWFTNCLCSWFWDFCLFFGVQK